MNIQIYACCEVTVIRSQPYMQLEHSESAEEKEQRTVIYIYTHTHKEPTNQSLYNPTSCSSSTLLHKIINSQQVTHKVITHVQKFCQYIDHFSFVDDFMSDVVVS